MRSATRRTAVLSLVVVLLLGAAPLLLPGCGDDETPADPLAGVSDADLAANNRGVGLMGRYDFPAAVEIFAPLAKAHPGWLDLQVNHAIALFNRSRPDTDDLGTAARILAGVLKRKPDHTRALYCSGILLLNRGRCELALPYFERIAKAHPEDAHAAYFCGHCLHDLDKPKEALRWFTAARDRDPSLRSAYYGGFQVLRALGREAEAAQWMNEYKRREKDIQSHLAEIKYTRMGPEAAVIASDRPGPPVPPPTGPRFQPVALVGNASGKDTRAWRSDRQASLSFADIDGDGLTDVFAAAAFAEGAPQAVLLRRGEDFERAPGHALAAVPGVRAALWGDFDDDGLTDVYLCCEGANHLVRQKAKGVWEDVTAGAHAAGSGHRTAGGAFVDFDHDGDLDLLLQHADAPLEILVNRRDGTFMPLPAAAKLPLAERPCTGLVLGDFDADRDLDLLLLHEGAPNEVWINDRLWAWHAGIGVDALVAAASQAGLALDTDADGQVEIILVGIDGALTRFAPDAQGIWRGHAFAAAAGSADHAVLSVLDAEGDGDLDLLLSAGGAWRLLDAVTGALKETSPATGGPWLGARPLHWSDKAGAAILAWAPGKGPTVWRPGPGRHPFASLTLSGRDKLSDQMRSNASGIGTRAAAHVDGRWTVRWTYRPQSGPGQSLQPLALGLRRAKRIDFVNLLWTDGLLQTETALEGGKRHAIQETQRQTSSCPVLFAWDGSRYAFVTDCLGVGGTGFWVAPDTYAPPTPRETLLLPAGLLQPKDGAFVLKLGEPMEEGCYLDGAFLEAVDIPPGWHVTIDERMAVEGPAPTGALVYSRDERVPTVAVDQAGVDMRAALLRADAHAADVAPVDARFIGRTAEQVLTLVFDRPLTEGAGLPVLVADGWIEYPYAQTLFAAWQADAAYDAPTVEARAPGGAWTTVLTRFGYPAGMPRPMSVPLVGLPAGARELRIRTTQEIYWDRLAVVRAEACPQAVRTKLVLRSARLVATGFALRTTGPQRRPHYDYGRRAPLWDTRHQRGLYTAFGDVALLTSATDDAVVVFGPGEEVELRFALPKAPPPEGWTRRYVLRTTGWCKDMDLFTKDGETIGPLPVRDPARATSARRDALHARTRTRYRSGG